MSTASTIFQIAEALSAISLPIGGGLAAYAKWRRNAERDRRAREEAARIASETAAREARKEEQQLRDALLQEKNERIRMINEKNERITIELGKIQKENQHLHNQIVEMLRDQLVDRENHEQ